MMKAPEKLGSEYYRGFLTRQGQAFYDRINAQLLRGDYSGKTTFSISNPETSASDCLQPTKRSETITQSTSSWGFRVNLLEEVGAAL